MRIEPRAKTSWQEYFINDDVVQTEGVWKFWYGMPYGCTREVRLQSFHYRILTRVLPCNEYLHHIRIKPSSKCSFCDKDEDDLIHFLFECEAAADRRRELVTWLGQFSQTNYAT